MCLDTIIMYENVGFVKRFDLWQKVAGFLLRPYIYII